MALGSREDRLSGPTFRSYNLGALGVHPEDAHTSFSKLNSDATALSAVRNTLRPSTITT